MTELRTERHVCAPFRVILLARNVVEHVCGERKELLPDEHPQNVDRRVTEMFAPVN